MITFCNARRLIGQFRPLRHFDGWFGPIKLAKRRTVRQPMSRSGSFEVIMWLSARMRQSFALGGLVVSAIIAYIGIEDHWHIVPAVLVYGLTKLGLLLIPRRG
jgi:hypothetical protein